MENPTGLFKEIGKKLIILDNLMLFVQKGILRNLDLTELRIANKNSFTFGWAKNP
jgi:hypothetical protein